MTASTLLQPLVFREFDANGAALAFGTVTSYQAGTVTPTPTYTDSTAVTQNANPLTLNNRGEANIYVLPNVNLKFVVKDQAGNQIRVTDNVQQSQIITLYGGVDTGSGNAYILTFVAAFSNYVDGTVIYFIPSHANTGPATINVNGLGVINIVNQNGTALAANALLANQVAVIIYKSGSFLLVQGAAQGIVSYGGLDTGAVNAYVVALANQSFAYQAGNVLFFIPSVTNTGPSTINVKGLGAQNILLQGQPLQAGQISANFIYELVYTGTAFSLINPNISLGGSFVLTAVGMTTSPTMTVYYTIISNIVTLKFAGVSGTSNSTNFSLTGFPNGLTGLTQGAVSPLLAGQDNSALGVAYTWSIPNQIGGSSVPMSINNASGLWTAAGSKGISAGTFSYLLL